jgi:hypothetical protein
MKRSTLLSVAALALVTVPAGSSLALHYYAFRHMGMDCIGGPFNNVKVVDIADAGAIPAIPHDWGVFAADYKTFWCPVAVNIPSESGFAASVVEGKIVYSTIPTALSGPENCRLWAVISHAGGNQTPTTYLSPPTTSTSSTTSLNHDNTLTIADVPQDYVSFFGEDMTRIFFSCQMPSSSVSSIKALIKGYEVRYSIP